MDPLIRGTYTIVRELPGQAFRTWEMVPWVIRKDLIRAGARRVGLGEASPIGGIATVALVAAFGLFLVSQVKKKG